MPQCDMATVDVVDVGRHTWATVDVVDVGRHTYATVDVVDVGRHTARYVGRSPFSTASIWL